jgi:hypothetical protein
MHRIIRHIDKERLVVIMNLSYFKLNYVYSGGRLPITY